MEITVKNAVKRKPRYLYYIDEKGNLCETKSEKSKGKIIIKEAIKRKPLHLYYIDIKGNICEVKMIRTKK